MPDAAFASFRSICCGSEPDAVAIYEQLIAHRVRIYFRYLDEFGDPVVLSVPQVGVRQLGFGDGDNLFGIDHRIFRGFDLLREYFMFPRKFLGVALTGLEVVIPRLKAKSVDVLFVFNEVNSRLTAAVQTEMFSLYTAPAVNLFEKTTDRIPVRPNQHEYHVVTDRSRYLDFEPHRILEVYAHYPGRPEKVPVPPVYAASLEVAASEFETRLFGSPPAAPIHRRGEEVREVVRLYWNGHVPFSH